MSVVTLLWLAMQVGSDEHVRTSSSVLVLPSVVSVANVLFEWTNLFSERNHFRTDLFLSQFSWAQPWSCRPRVELPWLTENCKDVILVRAVIRSWFANLLHTENWRWGRDSRSRTVLKVALCHSLTQGRGVDSRSVTVLLKLALCC